jgi:hypothetical protein
MGAGVTSSPTSFYVAPQRSVLQQIVVDCAIERRLTTLEVAVDLVRAEPERIRAALEKSDNLEPLPFQ